MKNFYFKGLKVEYKPSLGFSDRVMILCPGLPTSSNTNEERIFLLRQKGFHVFLVLYPGYPGSSKENFLLRDPADLVSELITFLRKRGVRGVSLKYFYLIGSSFGGSVVLNVENADKVVAISPVVDYKNLYKDSPDYNYQTLKKYLTESKYRISNEGWSRLKSGKLFKFSNGNLKDKTLIIYSKEDKQIRPVVLKRFIREWGVESIPVASDKHLSFKNISPRVFRVILRWLEKQTPIHEYNNNAFSSFEKAIAGFLDKQSAIVLTGSLAAGNLVVESDIDVLFISKKKNSRIPIRIKNRVIEKKLMTFQELSGYAAGNMRGLCKLFSSKLITNNLTLQKKIARLRKQLMSKYKQIYLAFLFLEKQRMEEINYQNKFSPLAIKKGIGGRRSLGFMSVTFNAQNRIDDPSFWDSLSAMSSRRVITEKNIQHIETFFNFLTKKKRGNLALDKLVKLNSKIIDGYVNKHFLNVKKKFNKGYFKDMFDSLYSRDSLRLTRLFNNYSNHKDNIKKYIICYYLSLNNNLPLDTGKAIVSRFANDSLMNNVRRNLVENRITDTHKKLLYLLAKDSDPKIRCYAKNKLTRKNILRSELIRCS